MDYNEYLEKLKKIKINNNNKDNLIKLFENIKHKDLILIIYDELKKIQDNKTQKEILPLLDKILKPAYKKSVDHIDFKAFFYDNSYTIFIRKNNCTNEIVSFIEKNSYSEIILNYTHENKTILTTLDIDKIEEFVKNCSINSGIKVFFKK